MHLSRLISLWSVLLALTLPSLASADTDLRWVVVELGIGATGATHVTYRCRWSNPGTDMHGFYLQGTAGHPTFTPSVAVLPGSA